MIIGLLSIETGVAKSGTLQIPFLRILCQSSPSFISPLTPMESIMRPFWVGRLGSTGGSETVGVGDCFGSPVGETRNDGVMVSVGDGCGVWALTVDAIVLARLCEAPELRR